MAKGYQTKEDKPLEEVVFNKYNLLIGFETNFATAFVQKKVGILKRTDEYVQILQGEGSDYGHAFFYITKNNIVENIFSFGPKELGEQTPKKGTEASEENYKVYANGYVNKRPAVIDYDITEVVKIFKLEITETQFNRIKDAVLEISEKVNNGSKLYHVLMNDTCAEEAEDILDDIIPDLPNGKGYVEIDGRILPFKVVNPYMWCKQLYEIYGKYYVYPEYPTKGKASTLFDPSGDQAFSVQDWIPAINKVDPLVKYGYYN